MQLDPKQQAAVLHADGPAIVVAGPGSGKTAVLTHRIDHLIRQLNIPPEKIMVITFTRAAADEMRSRFQAFPGETDAPAFFATFHAAFYRILRREEGLSARSVLGNEEKKNWIREMLKGEENRSEEFAGELSAEIAAFKTSGTAPGNYQAMSCGTDLFLRVASEYEERLRSCGKVDFEDMLVRTRRLLLEKPAVLRVWQERFSYILVDEFQDVSRLQYEVLKMLAEPLRNLFVVGDDDQSIYRFRGADPGVMASFPKDYPEAVKYELFGCRRCSPEILKCSSALISHNRNRFKKSLFSLAKKGKPPEIRMFPDRRTEHEALCEAIRDLHGSGVPYGRMAVLCRTNFGLGGVFAALKRGKIPCRSRETVPDIHRAPECRDIFAYLELASGKNDRSLFLRIANRPLRFLPRAAFAEDPVDRMRLLSSFRNRPGQREAVEELLYRLAVIAKLKPYAAVSYVRNETGYDKWVKEKDGGNAAALETLDFLQEESAAFSSFAEWKAYMAETEKAETALPSSEKRTDLRPGACDSRPQEDSEDAVELGTMHGAKGLEYDAVFLPDVIEGNVPHRKSRSGDALEEERRLFYVAVTRAARYLWIGWIRRDRAGKCEPSRFLKELQ